MISNASSQTKMTYCRCQSISSSEGNTCIWDYTGLGLGTGDDLGLCFIYEIIIVILSAYYQITSYWQGLVLWPSSQRRAFCGVWPPIDLIE